MSLQTPLHAEHVKLGAKMMPFAGYDMPVRYAGDKEEHMAVREKVGMFDVSHMGEFLVRGPKALELLQTITTNDVSKAPVGKAQYNCMLRPDGGIIDDLIVYHLADELFMMVVNAANLTKDWEWVNEQNESIGAELENISDRTALIALSGPRVVELAKQLTDVAVEEIPFYAFDKGTFAGIDNVVIATTGYTGERCFEIYVRADHAVDVWQAAMQAGEALGIQPCGLGARDTLRLEAGYNLYGNDMDETTNPYEAAMGWITKPKKGDFIGRDAVVKAKEEGLERRLMAFEMTERGIPRHGTKIVGEDGADIGVVTSGTFSPSLEKGVGFAYVPFAMRKEGTEIFIQIRKNQVPAFVKKAPLVSGTSLQKWLDK
jgi:aminomethyltransferase